jgi:hypothetical protein
VTNLIDTDCVLCEAENKVLDKFCAFSSSKHEHKKHILIMFTDFFTTKF